jgi:hypothetical protein
LTYVQQHIVRETLVFFAVVSVTVLAINWGMRRASGVALLQPLAAAVLLLVTACTMTAASIHTVSTAKARAEYLAELAHGYAADVTALGAATVTPSTSPDDHVYLNLIAQLKRWTTSSPS